jgi:hypothetical protein
MISTHSDYYANILQNGYQCISAFCVSNQMCAVWIKDNLEFHDLDHNYRPISVFPPEGMSKIVCLEMIRLSQIHRKNTENEK